MSGKIGTHRCRIQVDPMRIRALFNASLLAAALALPCASPSLASILINIDKSAQRMSVSVDGELRYTWPISTGRAGYVTPNGTFKPFRMEADHYSKEWDDAPMPHSIFFTKIGHAIHGSYETKRLGSAASHGCVRLSPAHATTLYSLVKAEGLSATTVVISGQNPVMTAGRPAPTAVSARARSPAPAAEADGQEPMSLTPDRGYGQRYGQGYGLGYYGQPYGQQYIAQPAPAYQPQIFQFQPFRPY
jgi:hypothetical protein